MEEMVLIGSRNLGINGDNADYDYAILDIEDGGTFNDIVNDHFEKNKHCYHYNREYRYKVARFEIDDTNDFQFIYNPEDFKAGLIDVNPLDYKDKWIERLKGLDFFHWYWFSNITKLFKKRFYHIVYNLEVIKENTIQISSTAMDRVRLFHDMKATPDDYMTVINEIKNLS